MKRVLIAIARFADRATSALEGYRTLLLGFCVPTIEALQYLHVIRLSSDARLLVESILGSLIGFFRLVAKKPGPLSSAYAQDAPHSSQTNP